MAQGQSTMFEGAHSPSEPDMQGAEAFLRFRESVPMLTDEELVRRVNGDFSAAFWRRFQILASKLHAEAMTHREQQEFMTYTDRTEAVRRVKRRLNQWTARNVDTP